MKKIGFVIFFIAGLAAWLHADVKLYERWERTLSGPNDGNPYESVELDALFTLEGASDSVTVTGFYDGDGRYVVRFLPLKPGKWNYTTRSNAPMLDGITGSLRCRPEAAGHGPVRVKGRHGFVYDDSTRYIPFGTTCYSWAQMTPELQKATLNSMRQTAFNKVRMCVMPKSYSPAATAPELMPFMEGAGPADSLTVTTKAGLTYDMTRYNPEFFRNMERAVDGLAAMGVEADLIIFHPYDKGEFGHDALPHEVNKRFARYFSARMAAFPNVWWSMANEYDYVKSKTEAHWLELMDAVDSADPYGHLLSIHGSTATYFPYDSTPRVTHTSIQDEAPVMEHGRAAILRSIFRKPVVLDEVCYEGNLPRRWGRLSGQEMIHRMWCALLGGTFAGHGESLLRHTSEADSIMWLEGVGLQGESWKRIGFMRDIAESMPSEIEPADISRDIVTSTAGPGHYLVYFGTDIADSWAFNLPAKCAGYEKLQPGTQFKVEIIDTWNMTVTPWPEIMEVGPARDYRHTDVKGRTVRLPLTPYILLRITKV